MPMAESPATLCNEACCLPRNSRIQCTLLRNTPHSRCSHKLRYNTRWVFSHKNTSCLCGHHYAEYDKFGVWRPWFTDLPCIASQSMSWVWKAPGNDSTLGGHLLSYIPRRLPVSQEKGSAKLNYTTYILYIFVGRWRDRFFTLICHGVLHNKSRYLCSNPCCNRVLRDGHLITTCSRLKEVLLWCSGFYLQNVYFNMVVRWWKQQTRSYCRFCQLTKQCQTNRVYIVDRYVILLYIELIWTNSSAHTSLVPHRNRESWDTVASVLMLSMRGKAVHVQYALNYFPLFYTK